MICWNKDNFIECSLSVLPSPQEILSIMDLQHKKLKLKIQLPNSMEIKWPEFSGQPSRMNSFILSLILTFNTSTLESNIETKQTTKSLLIQPKLLKNAKLVLNVPPSLLIKQELKNSILKKCGKVQMELSVIILMEPFSESQS
jgi:hypothetical protein